MDEWALTGSSNPDCGLWQDIVVHSSGLTSLVRVLGFDEAKPPEILYHYTSMSALLSIVKSGRIWATHFRFLNDRSEIKTMWDAVQSRLEERIVKEGSADVAHALSEVAEAVKGRRSSNEFVASFSENGDDLTQWRSYCNSGAGVSLGFSNTALESWWVSDPAGGQPSWVGGRLMKIRYLDDKNIAALDPVIDNALDIADQLSGEQGFFGTMQHKDIARAALGLVAPSYKHAAFRHECEWRLVVNKPHKPMPGRRFRPGISMLIPYVEVDLNRNLKFELSETYMLRKVIVGPTPNPELAEEALRSLFETSGHRVDVERSSIPFCNW